MSHLPPSVLRLARVQHGAVSSEQLDAHGVSPYRRRKLVEAGEIECVHPHVYRFATAEPTLLLRCVEACLAVPDLVISGTTAGRVLALRYMKGDDLHGMVYRRLVELEGVVVHRTNSLDPRCDVVVRADGIRLLAVPRLIFDLARFLDDDEFESVVEQLLDRRLVDIPALFAIGRRLRKSGRDGSLRFARVLGRRPMWAKPKDSDYEVRLLRALGRKGILLEPQYEVELPGGQLIHLDGADPVRRFGVEVDHVTWHGGRVATQHDKWRDRQTTKIGWYVGRVTDDDIDHHLAATVNDLVEIYRDRPAA